jgi:hypothetical protein
METKKRMESDLSTSLSANDMKSLRVSEIRQVELNIKSFVTRIFNLKMKKFSAEYDKRMGSVARLDSEYVELSNRVTKLERILQRGKDGVI